MGFTQRLHLSGANLRGADLTGAHLAETRLDAETELAGTRGLDEAAVVSIIANGRLLRGADARAWLRRHAERPRWTIVDLELWLLSKMSSAKVGDALRALGVTPTAMAEAASSLAPLFDEPGHAAAEYRRVLGRPVREALVAASGAFAGSTAQWFSLPLWPDVEFVVHEATDGAAWNVGFRADRPPPDDVDALRPWEWTFTQLCDAATVCAVEEEWSYDRTAIFTFARAGATTNYRGRFDLDLLQTWDVA